MIEDIPGKLEKIDEECKQLRHKLKEFKPGSDGYTTVLVRIAFNNGQMNILRELL